MPSFRVVIPRSLAGAVTPEVARLLGVLRGEMSREQLMKGLGLKDPKHFREAYLKPALAAKMIEMNLPQAPRSSRQRYRRTALGRQ